MGIGLAMLEEVFAEEGEHITIPGDKHKTGKRRKAEMHALLASDFDDDDDDDHYPPVNQAKKLKLGVGYAGDVREDVSVRSTLLLHRRGVDLYLAVVY